MKRMPFLLSLLILFICGCGERSPAPKINVYNPIAAPGAVSVTKEAGVTYAVAANDRYSVKTALYEYKGIYVAEIFILNRTKNDIATKEYSIRLVDGKDRKPLAMVPKETIRQMIKERGGKGAGFTDAEKMLSDVIASLFVEIKPSDEKLVIKGLEMTLERYFEDRPIWAGKSREGLIVYSLDFLLEYPLTLAVTLPGEKFDTVFEPSNEGIEKF